MKQNAIEPLAAAACSAAFDKLAADIADRRGLKWEWEKISHAVMNEEIRPAWEAIIAEAIAAASPQNSLIGGDSAAILNDPPTQPEP